MTPGLRAHARFFLRIGQMGRVAERLRDDYTRPLFPLVLILEADGTLAKDARHLITQPRERGRP